MIGQGALPSTIDKANAVAQGRGRGEAGVGSPMTPPAAGEDAIPVDPKFIYTRQGHVRPSDAEIARQLEGEQTVRNNYLQLQLMRQERAAEHAKAIASGQAPPEQAIALPTYGRILPDPQDMIVPPEEPLGAESSPGINRAAEDITAVLQPIHRVDLKLDLIQNPKVRAIFDPAQIDDAGSIDSLLTWSKEDLDQLLIEMRPEHMAVLMRKRIHSHQQAPAKRLSFHHLQYWEKGEYIIKDCSGFIEPGEMVGVSGGPDSGVTALLGLLAGRLKPNSPPKKEDHSHPYHTPEEYRPPQPKNTAANGYILYDGKLPRSDFSQQVGYAVKADIHLPYLTVAETLEFSARLRLHRSLPDEIINFRVRAMMKLLGLSHVANTPVGDAMVRGVSGGEKRRVGFGVEMVAGHSVILADLPTNGLDSATALSLLQSMAYACAGGFSLMFSIVQASQAILDTMDRLILLCKGSIIFTGNPKQAEPYFRSLGFQKPPSKALPQFLEEMSANPERFWMPYLTLQVGQPASLDSSAFYDPRSPTSHANSTTSKSLKTNGSSTGSVLPPSEDESAYKGHFDPNLELPPRRQAYISLRTAWHRAPAYREMMTLLDESRVARKQPVSLYHQLVGSRIRKGGAKGTSLRAQRKREKMERQKSERAANDQRWQRQLMLSTAPLSSATPALQNSAQPPQVGIEMAASATGPSNTLVAPTPMRAMNVAAPLVPEPAPIEEAAEEVSRVRFHSGESDEEEESAPTASSQPQMSSESLVSGSPGLEKTPAVSPPPVPLNWSDQDAVESHKLKHMLARRNSNSVLSTPKHSEESSDEPTMVAVPDAEQGYAKYPEESPLTTSKAAQAFAERQQPPSNSISSWWYHQYSSDPWTQFRMNFKRQWLATIRNPGLWRDIWILSAIIGILIGLLFIDLATDEDGVRMRVSLFFFIISYQAFNAVMLVPVLAQQRHVYYTQLQAGYHCSFAYYLPLALIQIPIVVVECLLLITPIYGISDLEGGEWQSKFWYMFLAVFFNSLIARTFMIALFAISPTEVIADVINQVANILFSKLCGFFIAATLIPVGWYWVYVISWFTYALRGLAKNDVLGLTRDCRPSIDDSCLYSTGAGALRRLYQIDPSIDKWDDIRDLFFFLIAFHFAAAMILAFVDWSELDRIEAPDFGTKRQQLAEAAEAAQNEPKQVAETSPSAPKLLMPADAAAMAEPNGTPSGSELVVKVHPAGELVLSPPRYSVPQREESILSVNSRTMPSRRRMEASPSSRAQQSLNSSSLTLTGRQKFQRTLQKVLRTYESGNALDENGEKKSRFSYIVLPLEEPTSARRADWPVGRPRKLTRALSDAATHPPEMTPFQFPRPHTTNESAPPLSLGEPAYDHEMSQHSLQLADAHHYQHQVKRLNISALMSGAAPEVVKGITSPVPDVSGAPVALTPKAQVTGAVLEWYDLTYTVPVKRDDGTIVQRKLLNKVYGLCKPGLMVALMGSSGAGKSTLLDVLANKKTGGHLSGTLLLNGKPRDANFAHVTGYVEQWDSHHPYSTVREALEFSGRLRLRTHVSDEELARRVDNTLQILGIEHLQNQLIGGEGVAGVSQEVRKKVTIAVELITEPQLLFLDEPTTGLDAAGAYSVCHAIRTLANHIAVICTIHQPSEEIVSMFDGLLLMQPGGSVAYCGSVAELPDYFKEHRLGSYRKGQNVADFALESIRLVTTANATTHRGHKEGEPAPVQAAGNNNHAVPPSTTAEKETLVKENGNNGHPMASPAPGAAGTSSVSPGAPVDAVDVSHYRDLPAEFLVSEPGAKLNELLRSGGAHKQFIAEKGGDPNALPTHTPGENDRFEVPPQPLPLRSFFVQLESLMSREFSGVMRNHEDLAVRYFLTIFMGFVVGTVFWQLGDGQAAADERISALFVTLLFIMFTANAFLPNMFSCRPMYFREYTAGAYSAAPFYLARLIVQLPFILTENLILAIMLYYIADLNRERHDVPLAWMYLCFVVTRYASLTATYFIGAIFQRANNANTIHATYFNLLFAFTGFLVRGPRIPIGWVWFYDINYLRWALDFLTANEVRNKDFTCNMDEFVLAPADYHECTDPQSVTTVGQSPNLIPPNASPIDTANPNTVLKCVYACGRDLMESYGVDGSDGDMARNLGIVACFAAAFGIAGFLVLKYVNHIQR